MKAYLLLPLLLTASLLIQGCQQEETPNKRTSRNTSNAISGQGTILPDGTISQGPMMGGDCPAFSDQVVGTASLKAVGLTVGLGVTTGFQVQGNLGQLSIQTVLNTISLQALRSVAEGGLNKINGDVDLQIVSGAAADQLYANQQWQGLKCTVFASTYTYHKQQQKGVTFSPGLPLFVAPNSQNLSMLSTPRRIDNIVSTVDGVSKTGSAVIGQSNGMYRIEYNFGSEKDTAIHTGGFNSIVFGIDSAQRKYNRVIADVYIDFPGVGKTNIDVIRSN